MTLPLRLRTALKNSTDRFLRHGYQQFRTCTTGATQAINTVQLTGKAATRGGSRVLDRNRTNAPVVACPGDRQTLADPVRRKPFFRFVV
jgi:hypothetical protein